jgi:transposase
MKTPTIRYSEAFKRQVVGELEAGKFATIGRAQRAYGIRGSETIRNWVRLYGSSEHHPKITRIQTMKEQDELKNARARIRKLEAALSDAHIDYVLEEAYLKVACRHLGVELNDFKKKNAATLSQLRRNPG